MPKTILVFIGDASRLARNDLFSRCTLRGSARHVVTGERLGEHPTDAVSPAAVMFDDLICDLGHVWLLAMGMLFRKCTRATLIVLYDGSLLAVGRSQSGMQRRHDTSALGNPAMRSTR